MDSADHITPADGNLFEDLGSPPEEAATLLAEADAQHLAKVIAAMTWEDLEKLIAESEPLAASLREVLKVAGQHKKRRPERGANE